MTKRLALFVGLTGMLIGSTDLVADGAHSIFGRVKAGTTFNRPVEDGSALSGIGTAVNYTVQPFYPSVDSHCWIRSTQWGGVNGMIFLYGGGFDPASPLANFIAGDDNGDTGVGTSEIEDVDLSFSGTYYLVTTTYTDGEIGNYLNTIECESSDSPAEDVLIVTTDWSGFLPDYDGTYNVLNNGRFRVSGTWRDYSSNTGDATFVPLGSLDTGILWFFSPTNWEVMIKVLNGCAINNRYWVYLAATTDVEYTITVRDLDTSETATYSNTLGTQSPAFTDSDAFATCP